MTKRLIDFDALLATLDSHDDDILIDRFLLIILAAHHLREDMNDENAANELLFSYEICPMHECDIQICNDDEIDECADLRATC